jgi:hypothetical protein
MLGPCSTKLVRSLTEVVVVSCFIPIVIGILIVVYITGLSIIAGCVNIRLALKLRRLVNPFLKKNKRWSIIGAIRSYGLDVDPDVTFRLGRLLPIYTEGGVEVLFRINYKNSNITVKTNDE